MAICSIKYNRIAVLGLALVAGVFLAACRMHHPSYMSEERLQVHTEPVTQTIPAGDLDAQNIQEISRLYTKRGTGPLRLTVTYDPRHERNTAMHASDTALWLTESFRKEGLKGTEVSIMPVKDSGAESKVLISYTAHYAKAPDGCSMMPGLSGDDIEAHASYKLGCSMDSIFAQQIAHPSDLIGHAAVQDTTDGRRSATVVERYRSGAQNEALEGESASGTE